VGVLARGADRFRGRAATVMGLGLFGGGAGAARYLVNRGARVTVTDLKDAAALAPSIRALEGLPITYHLGGHVPADFTAADILVVNPGVDKRKSGFVHMAETAGAEITSEMNLFIEACPAPVLGVTGSSGKSTTTALAGAMLRGHRPSRVGGNIGISLLDEIGEIRPDEWVVLELSSFQLQDLAALRWSPRLAVATCLSENHLDRHESMENYVEAKKNIVRFQSLGDTVVLNADDEALRLWEPEARRLASRAVWYSTRRPLDEGVFIDGPMLVFRLGAAEERVDLAGRVHLLGRHNLSNIAAAAAAARLLDVPAEAIAGAVGAFRPLPHRLEPVGRLGGVLLVDDSKATTPAAAAVSMEAFEQPIVLIAGGRDKDMKMAPMIEAIRRRTRAVVLIGEMAGAIQAALENRENRDASHFPHFHDGENRENRDASHFPHFHDGKWEASLFSQVGPPVHRAGDMPEAVARAVHIARPGDVVLLAPGYTSLDMFDNYERRGDAFRQAARGLGMEPLVTAS
jgi:UDP-N-acetylmuramoylalanine--D-glutamate ligase